MSGYLEGVVVLLAINIILAYGAFLPIAAGQLNLGVAGFVAMGAYIAETLIAKGCGPSKQKAEDEAAREAIRSKGWDSAA